MPAYTIYYSNTSGSPPIGNSPPIAARDLEEAVAFAEQHCPRPSHQPSVGDIRGFCICDAGHEVVVSWREGCGQGQALLAEAH